MTALLVAIMVLADAASDVLMTRAMKQVGMVRDFRPMALWRTAGRVLRNASFMVGIVFAALHFVAFLWLLSYAELSFVIPAAALVYVASTLGARLFLGEQVSVRRWSGVLLVFAGVALVSLP